jgi:hypothetical protein
MCGSGGLVMPELGGAVMVTGLEQAGDDAGDGAGGGGSCPLERPVECSPAWSKGGQSARVEIDARTGWREV